MKTNLKNELLAMIDKRKRTADFDVDTMRSCGRWGYTISDHERKRIEEELALNKELKEFVEKI